MNSILAFLATNPVIALFLIVGLGVALGHLTIRGFSLGPSAVMFVGMLFGHWGIHIPDEINTLGIILFVYSVGLSAGPRFFSSIRRNGLTYFLISFLSLSSGLVVIWLLARLFHLSPGLGVGIYSGALTSTPGLAAALDVVDDPAISIGYGIAYPAGLIGVILFVQFIANLKSTREEQIHEKEDPTRHAGKVLEKHYLVTNPNCTGKPIAEIDFHSMTQANITRVKRGENIFLAHDDTVLHLNDIIRVVGTQRELKKLEHLIGKETQAEMDFAKDIVIRDVYISNYQIAGKSIQELEVHSLFGVIITRLRRDEVEIAPTGQSILEIGDLIRIVGDKDDCDAFVRIAGQQERRIHETNLLPLTLGMVAGAVLGSYYFQLPGGIRFRLGMAGGPLLVALVISHFGRIGRISTRIPYAAKYLTREIGLVFFLAAAGADAGSSFWEVFRAAGLKLIGFGALTTLVPVLTAYALAVYVFRMGNLAAIGVVCGGMTSTPALGAVTSRLDSETPTIAYASIYAISMVLVTTLNQLLAIWLM
ncbi:MAG: aspartate:alanine exchanger family transporter [bacterium]